MLRLSRRGLLLAIGGLACRPALSYADTGLGQIAASRGLLYGSAISGTLLARDPAYAAMMGRECGLVVSGAEIHWALVAPSPTVTNLSKADAIYAWAAAHRIKFRGHALVWHGQAPAWFADLPDRATAVAALQDHIRIMCKHFAGHMHAWDVVNEAILTNSVRADNLRDTIFIRKIGPEYLDIAFQTARDSDPHALLVYNQDGLELDYSWQGLRRTVLLDLIDGFKKRGTPVDAIGIQGHLQTATMPHFNERIFSDFLREIAARGLQIMLTELDVADKSAPSDIPQRDAEVASAYKRFLDVALDNKSVSTVITWGLSDNDSWITHGAKPEFRREDGLTPRPLPFDATYRPKAAYAAIAEALRAAPKR
jgi:endo-1,4-beta-xylanase